MKSLLFSVFLLLLTSVVYAGELPGEIKDVSTMIREDVKKTHLTLFGLAPGTSTVEEVTALLGYATPEKIGSGERSIAKLCYVSSADDNTKVVFEASAGEPGGVISRITLYSGDVRYRGAGSCIASKFVNPEVATESGLALGLSEARFTGSLGTPTEKWPGYVGYEYHALKKLSNIEVERVKGHWPYVLKYPYVDIHSSIEGRFHKGKLKRLDLRRIVAKP